MVETGNPNSISDAGVGVLALYACMEGAWLNVQINAADIQKHPRVLEILAAGRELLKTAEQTKSRILERVHAKIAG